jgi:hypothetical protein
MAADGRFGVRMGNGSPEIMNGRSFIHQPAHVFKRTRPVAQTDGKTLTVSKD